MCRRDALNGVAQFPRAVGRRFPVDGGVALADDDLKRAVDRVEFVGPGGRCQDRTGGQRRVGAGGRPQRHTAAEAVAEQPDPVVPVGGPGEGPFGVGRTQRRPPLVVPWAVVEPETGNLGRDGVAHRPEPRVRPGAAVSRVGRTGHDNAVGVGGVEAAANVPAAGYHYGLAHIRPDAGEVPVAVVGVANYLPGRSEPAHVTADTSDVDPAEERPDTVSDSDRRRRSVRQLLFVIAGAHTGAFVGSVVPTFGLPGDAVSVGLVVGLLVLPFAVDAKWAAIDRLWLRLVGET